ncbi:hypothetical protein GTZ78_28370 [Streptomyces sp. SID8361]|nr:hypothetical protein [Streptomyces sp. SID8361]
MIIPEVIVVDGGKAFLSKNFHTACNAFGTEVSHTPPPHPDPQAPHRKNSGLSVASLLAQCFTAAGNRPPASRLHTGVTNLMASYN